VGKEAIITRPRWARVAASLLAIYLLCSTVLIFVWIGLGTVAAIDHNKDAEYCDYSAAPPGYTNFISGQDCTIRWGYIFAKHGLVIIAVSLITQSPALGAIWWLGKRYPSKEEEAP